jgi:hypothetical protein
VSDRNTCPRCGGAQSDERITQRDHVCEHCHHPFGDVRVPDHAGRLSSQEPEGASRRGVAGAVGWAIGGLLAYCLVVCGLFVIAAVLRRDDVTFFALFCLPILSLAAVAWYLQRLSSSRPQQQPQHHPQQPPTVKKAGTTVLLVLLLLGVMLGAPILFFVTCMALR